VHSVCLLVLPHICVVSGCPTSSHCFVVMNLIVKMLWIVWMLLICHVGNVVERKQSSVKGRRKPSKDVSSVPGKTKKKTPAKKKPVTESAKANGMQKLMTSAKLLKNKPAPAAAVNRCWSWEHWRPVDSIQFGEEPLKGSRYDDLKNRLEHSLLI
jgi:hypothetical protein